MVPLIAEAEQDSPRQARLQEIREALAAHDAERQAYDRRRQDYENSLRESGDNVQSRNNATPALENSHHGRASASEGRRQQQRQDDIRSLTIAR